MLVEFGLYCVVECGDVVLFCWGGENMGIEEVVEVVCFVGIVDLF